MENDDFVQKLVEVHLWPTTDSVQTFPVCIAIYAACTQ